MSYKDLLKQAEAYFDKGDWEMASQAYGELIVVLLKEENNPLLARAHQRKGYADMRRAHYTSSVRHLTEALNISTAIDDIALATDILRSLGYVHWQTGTYELSVEFFTEAMMRASELKDNALLGKAKTDYGNLLNFQGKLDEAIEIYTEAIGLLEGENDLVEAARAHNNKGDALYRKKMFKESVVEFKEAIRLGEETDHMSRVAWARSNIALSYIELGQNALARDFIIIAKDHMERIGDRVGIGDVHESMGLLLMAEGKFEEAEMELRAGLGLATELDVPDRKAIAERNLGHLYFEIDQNNNARYHLGRAIHLFKDIGMTLEASRAQKMLDKVTERDD